MKTKTRSTLIINFKKSKIPIILIAIIAMILTSCNQTQSYDTAKIKAEVLETVYAHNRAWAELEDINEQKKYVHENIVFISPPYKKPITGKEEYLNSYQKDWMDHATVHHFNELDPDVKLYCNGLFAIVTFEIDMAFDLDDTKVPEWHGYDKMTLVKENGKWLITSDMYAQQVNESDQ
ncbi:nuclear transport factor 2 family protein [bacterium]|nr:nuclear transport factor 2 family protein [bacterium]